MSVGPVPNLPASAAGAPLVQINASASERVALERAAPRHRVENGRHAEDTAGVAGTDGHQQDAAERDTGGRLPWILSLIKKPSVTEDNVAAEGAAKPNATEARGGELDVTG